MKDKINNFIKVKTLNPNPMIIFILKLLMFNKDIKHFHFSKINSKKVYLKKLLKKKSQKDK